MECDRPIYIERGRRTDSRNKEPGPDRHEHYMGGRERRRTREEMENNVVCVCRKETAIQGRGTETTQETRPQRRFEAKSHETDGTGGRDGKEKRYMRRGGISGRVVGRY